METKEEIKEEIKILNKINRAIYEGNRESSDAGLPTGFLTMLENIVDEKTKLLENDVEL